MCSSCVSCLAGSRLWPSRPDPGSGGGSGFVVRQPGGVQSERQRAWDGGQWERPQHTQAQTQVCVWNYYQGVYLNKYQYEYSNMKPLPKTEKYSFLTFFFLVDVGFCLHFSKIVQLQQKCCVDFFIIIIEFGLWNYHDLRMSQVLGISSSTLRYFSKIKKEAFLWFFFSEIPLQFFLFFFCDLPLDSLLFSQILLHWEVEGF